MRWLRAGVAAAALLASGGAGALRCGHKLITKGDLDIEVQHYCGEPVAVSSRYALRTLVSPRGRVLFPDYTAEVLVEEWTYNFGPHRLMRVIRIEDGIVTDIEPLGYGFREKPDR